MSEEVTAFKYLIPLVTEDGGEVPEYSANTDCEVLLSGLRANAYEVVALESTPHFHKDSVNVSVEEVDATDYGYTKPEEDETNNDGEQEGGEE